MKMTELKAEFTQNGSVDVNLLASYAVHRSDLDGPGP